MADVDIRVNNPYRDVEMYLQKAEEEIYVTLNELSDRNNKNGKRQQQPQVGRRLNDAEKDQVPSERRRTYKASFSSNDNISEVSSSNEARGLAEDRVGSSGYIRFNGRHSSSTSSSVSNCKKQNLIHPLPPPRKRNLAKHSPRIARFMQSLGVLPTSWEGDADNVAYLHQSNGKYAEPTSNINRERSISVKELTRTPSTKMINSASSEFWNSNSVDNIDACNLDFSSTESVNRWFSHMLAELDSIPNVSLNEVDSDSTDDESGRRRRASIERVDRKLQEACTELRDVGRYDVCGSSSSESSLSSARTQVFRTKEKFNRKTSLNLPDDQVEEDEETVGGGDDDDASRVTHLDNNSARSSYTWPLEQGKSSSAKANVGGDGEAENGSSSSLLDSAPANSCEVHRSSVLIELVDEARKADTTRASSATNTSRKQQFAKDLTPTPSLDEIYSSVTPLASPDIERRYCFDDDDVATNHPNNIVSSTHSSHKSLLSTADVGGVELVKKRQQTDTASSANAKTDVATEISNSLKMQQQAHSPVKSKCHVSPYHQGFSDSHVDFAAKPKKPLAQEYACTNVLGLNGNGGADFHRANSPNNRQSLKLSTTDFNTSSSKVVFRSPPTRTTAVAKSESVTGGGNSIRGVVASIIKLAESEISPKIGGAGDRRSFKCRSAECGSNDFDDDDYDDGRSNSNESLCNSSRQFSVCHDACTQTTPFSLSRSSSFTWMSEGETENYRNNHRPTSEYSQRGNDSCARSNTDDDSDEDERSSVNSPNNDDEQCRKDADISLGLSELSGAESSEEDESLSSPPKQRQNTRHNKKAEKHRKAEKHENDPSTVFALHSTQVTGNKINAKDMFSESLRLLLGSVGSEGGEFAKNNSSFNAYKRTTNFTSALDACGDVQPRVINLKEEGKVNCNSGVTSAQRSSFNLPISKASVSKDARTMRKNGSPYSSEDAIYDNLPNLRRNDNEITPSSKRITYSSELLESLESPTSTTAEDVSVSLAMPRDLSIASGLLADSESSPVADSSCSPMSPIIDGFGLETSFVSHVDAMKVNSTNSLSSSEGSFNIVQAAPEFQYKTGEDYAREILKNEQLESSRRLASDCCPSSSNLVTAECDLIAESVLICRKTTIKANSNNNNDHESTSPSVLLSHQHSAVTDCHFSAIGSGCKKQPDQLRSSNCNNAALLCSDIKIAAYAGSLPVLDRLRDSDEFLRFSHRSGDGLRNNCAEDIIRHNGELSTNKISAEKEARQCCRWLRAAGFPQYAKLYEDRQFPIDIKSVQKDHEFLDSDSLQALFRRLHVLNRCAIFKLDGDCRSRTPDDESDDDDQVPLSRRWRFVRKSRTWSRIVNELEENMKEINLDATSSPMSAAKADRADASAESFILGGSLEKSAQRYTQSENLSSKPPTSAKLLSSSYQGARSTTGLAQTAEDVEFSPKLERKLQRSQSERIKDKAKAFVKRMDFRSNKRRKSPAGFDRNGDPPLISNPVLIEQITSASNLYGPRMFGDVNAMFSNKQTEKSCVAFDSAPTDATPSSTSAKPRTTVHHTCGSDERRRGRVFPSESSAEFEKVDVNGLPVIFNDNNSQRRYNNTLGVRSSNVDSIFAPVSFSADNNRAINRRRATQAEESSHQVQDSSKSNCLTSDSSPEIPSKTSSSLRVNVEQHSNAVGRQMHSSYDSSDADNAPYWERRDSGVGSSLSRSPSAPCKPRVRWHSFQRQHRPTTFMDKSMSSVSMDSLSVAQMATLQKYSLLKLTALMEKYSQSQKTSGWHWGVQKLFKRIKSVDQKIVKDNKQIFGVSLANVAQRTGQPLPQCILHAMRYLRKQSLDTVGIFRKSGVRSRIQKLKSQCEASTELTEYDSQQAYDVADTVKQYFRDLPEPLLTAKLSETFVTIFLYVPEHLRMEAVQKAVLLLPDENREALHSFVHFLHDIAAFSDTNQMTAQNLAVCLAPTLFQLSSRNMAMSPQRRHKTITGGIPNERELNENRAAQACLAVMIDECRRIFSVPEDIMMRCSFSSLENDEPSTLNDLSVPQGNYAYLNGCIEILLREHRERWRGWVTEGNWDGVDMSSKKVSDGHLLKLWRCWVDVEAPPKELLHRIIRERDLWDDDIIKWRVVRRLNESSEVFQYVCNDMPPHPTRDYCVLRKWLSDLAEIRGGCILVETSVNMSEAPKIGGVRGIVLASRYLIEPSGAGRSRITHIARIDTKGRSKSWYNKIFGYQCANHVARIRDSFRQLPDGPETKV